MKTWPLTDEEREQIETELVETLRLERRLAVAAPVSPEAAERKQAMLERVHASITRLSALLDEPPYPDGPLASRRADQ